MAGKLVHFELPAGDTSRAKGFWSGVFGWEFGDSAMPEFEYYMVRTGEDQGGAVMPSQGSTGLVVYFVTSNAWRIGQQQLVLNKYYDHGRADTETSTKTDDVESRDADADTAAQAAAARAAAARRKKKKRKR